MSKGRVVIRAPMAPLVWLARTASKDRRAYQGLPVRRVHKANPDHPAPLALTEILALRAIKAHRVPKDRKGYRGPTALQVLRESRARQG